MVVGGGSALMLRELRSGRRDPFDVETVRIMGRGYT